MALTYSTVLSIVPAAALLLAIGRGFGLQDLLQNQVLQMFPSQVEAIQTVLRFVDSYLTSATQGVFVGVGLVVLLYTVISLLSQVEDTFNSIWGVKQERSFFQKITDYIAICLLIPVLLICSAGVSIFMSSIIQDNVSLKFLTPLVNIALEIAPLILCWLAFTLSYLLIPNTKVQFKYAAIAGALAAVAFTILQLLFVNGTLYVSKYNAIYGSFAFLPLMLIWMQLSLLFLLTGCMLAYSMQNVFTFNLMGDESKISNIGWHNVAFILMSVIVKRFATHRKPLSEQEIAVEYFLPIRIVSKLVTKLKDASLVYEITDTSGNHGLVPAIESDKLTVAQLLKSIDEVGITNFVVDFDKIYSDFLKVIDAAREASYAQYQDLLIRDLPLPDVAHIRSLMIEDYKNNPKATVE